MAHLSDPRKNLRSSFDKEMVNHENASTFSPTHAMNNTEKCKSGTPEVTSPDALTKPHSNESPTHHKNEAFVTGQQNSSSASILKILQDSEFTSSID